MTYQARVQGELGPGWDDWFGRATVRRQADGVTALTCELPDQAALYGLLRKLQDLGLPLLSITGIQSTKGRRGVNMQDGTSKTLGIAFLLQAITSLASGMILKLGLIVPGNVAQSMVNVASYPWLLRTNILGEMITAGGIIFLGAMLYIVLRKQDERLALVGLGLYILEGALLAASRIGGFALLDISQQYVATGRPAVLEMMGSLALGSMSNGYTLLMLAFELGAMPFYWLLYRSRVIPRGLSVWGLVTVPIVLGATIATLFGVEVPFAVYLPYVPFEFVAGAWILARGLAKAEA